MSADSARPPQRSEPTRGLSSDDPESFSVNAGAVSVVIPVYKAARFVTRAVESALEQPEVLEVVLVEDGSPDNSLAICSRLADMYDRVRLFRHPGGINRGAGASRNLGIASATGSFLAFLDADDYFLPGRFHSDLSLLEKEPNLDGVYNAIGTEFYDDDGKARYAGRGQDETHLTTMRRRVEPEALFDAMAPVGKDGHFHANGLTVRRRIFERLDGFDPEMELSQDTLLFLQMALKCRLAPGRIDAAVAVRGVHTGNRIADEDKLRRFRGLLFQKLYLWMRHEGFDADRIGPVWELYYHYAALNYRGPELKYLVEHILTHPEVLIAPAFWRRVAGKFKY